LGLLLGGGHFLATGLCASAKALAGGQFAAIGAAIASGLWRHLPVRSRLGSVGRLRTRQPLAALEKASIGFRPCGLLGRSRTQPAALPVDLIGRRSGFGIGALSGPTIAGAIGNQEATELRGHLAAGRVMLPKKARQRSGGYCLEKTPGGPVAAVARSSEDLRWTLAGFKILRPRRFREGCKRTDEKHHRR
jgi:hypothetical protein